MRIELHDHLKNAVSVPATRVAVMDDFNNPVVLVVSQQPGHVSVHRIGDPDFDEQLKIYGIDRTVIVRKLPAINLRRGLEPLQQPAGG